MSNGLSEIDAFRYVRRAWIDQKLGPDDFNAAGIMIRLIMLGYPATRRRVLMVVRDYCDSETENKSYRQSRR